MSTDYGTSFSTFTNPDGSADLDPNFAKISGPRVIIERIARKLMTPTGSMFRAGWGYDVRDLLQGSPTPAEVAAAQGEIKKQCEDEEEVSAVTVTVNLRKDQVLSIEVVIALNTDQTFSLVFTLTADKVQVVIGAILQES